MDFVDGLICCSVARITVNNGLLNQYRVCVGNGGYMMYLVVAGIIMSLHTFIEL